jgi:hypothetical protein
MSTQGSSKTRNPGLREERRWRTRRCKLAKMEVIFGYFLDAINLTILDSFFEPAGLSILS